MRLLPPLDITMPHTASSAMWGKIFVSGAASFITARNASFSIVSGSARMIGLTESGKRSYEKKTPEQYLRELCEIGLQERYGPGASSEAQARINTLRFAQC